MLSFHHFWFIPFVFFVIISNNASLKNSNFSHLSVLLFFRLEIRETVTLKNVLLNFPLEKYNNDFAQVPQELQEDLYAKLAKFVELEPTVPINATCKPPVLEPLESIKCSDYPEAFTGERRSQYAKIAHAIQLGFDVDILEIHLNEIYPVVDKIFIIESPYTHFRGLQKPLIWQDVQNQTRFAKFKDKVVALVLNETNMKYGNHHPSKQWHNENLQEKMRWQFIKEWNEKNHYFNQDDVISFGDADEIACTRTFQLMRSCKFTSPVDAGTWVIHGAIERHCRSHYPIRGHPYTLGDPTFYTFEQAGKKMPFPSRNRGHSHKYLLGGMHMSRYAYLPQIIIKTIAATEFSTSILTKVKNHITAGLSLPEIERIERQNTINSFIKRYPELDQKEIGKNQYIIPWFLNCNRQRYPSLFPDGKPDKRYEIAV